MAELGPALLRKGVIITSGDLHGFVAGQSEDFWQGCRRITLDNKPVDLQRLQDAACLSGKDRVFLSVSAK